MKKLSRELLSSLVIGEEYTRYGDTMTICYLKIKGGFIVIGKSSCIDKESYNEEIGRNVAYEDAFEKLWELEGYHVKRSQSED